MEWTDTAHGWAERIGDERREVEEWIWGKKPRPGQHAHFEINENLLSIHLWVQWHHLPYCCHFNTKFTVCDASTNYVIFWPVMQYAVTVIYCSKNLLG